MGKYLLNSVLTVFAIMYTTISLYSCSAPQEASVDLTVVDIPAASASPTIVNIFQSKSEISQSLQEAIKLYSQANPDSYLNVTTVAGSDYNAALKTKLLSGDRCDIFHVFSGREIQEMSKNLLDISDMSWVSTSARNLHSSAEFNGRIYAVPYSIEGFGLMVNAKIFAQAGISAADIVTLKDLRECMAELSAQIKSGDLSEQFPQLKYVTDLPVQDKKWLAKIASNIVLSGEFATPTDAITKKEIKIPYGEGAKEFLDLLEAYSPKYDWTKRDGVSYMEQAEDFVNEKTAIIVCDSYTMQQACEANADEDISIILMPVPLNGQTQNVIYTGTPLWWAINANSAKDVQSSAKKFLTWLYQSESGTAVVAGRLKELSPYLELAKETGISIDNQITSYINREKTQPQSWQEYPYNFGEDIFAREYRKYFAGEQNWNTTITAIKEGWAFG